MENAKRNADKTIGSDVVGRLKRFTESLESLDDIRDLPARFTCHTIKLNLEPAAYGPEDVKAVREILRASQAIFAEFLGVSTRTVQDWEQGVTPPSGAPCRLMDEIQQNNDYWLNRLKELSKPVLT